MLLALLATRCSTADTSCEPLRATIAKAVGGDVTIAVKSGLPRHVRRELGAIPQRRIPAAENLDLPEGCLLITGWEESAQRLHIDATLGPVPHVPHGLVSLACGTRYAIELERSNGCWVVTRVRTSEC